MKLTVSYYKTEMVSIDKLNPFQGNLKDLSESNYKKLRKQILDNGFAEPFSVWENEGSIYILNGHQRHREIMKMKEEGINIPDLPCNFIRCANKKEAKKMILALTSQYGNMTEDGLYEFLEESGIGFEEMRDSFNFPEINMEDFGAGYYGDEIKVGDSKDDDFEMPDPETVETDIKLGDLFEIRPHRLLCGDSTDSDAVARLMNGEKADLVLTDPPYGIKRDKGFGGFWGFGGFGKPIPRRRYENDNWDSQSPPRECFNLHIQQAPSAIIFGGNYFTDRLPQGNFWIVWDKHNSMPSFGDCELAWTNIKRNSVKKYDILYNGLIGKEAERFHPTQKPVKLFSEILADFTQDNNLVFDGFLGSGTTMVAAHQLSRRCYGMELDPRYCQIIVDRMTKLNDAIEIMKNGEVYRK